MLARLRRRWSVLLIGLLVAAGLATTTWMIFPKTYERTASQVLLPGTGTVPADTNNPYLYLSGLTQAADVVVLAVGSDNVRNEIDRDYPGASYEISRDSTTSGPVILITAQARTDAVAADVLHVLITRTAEELKRLQVTDQVSDADQITVVLVSKDDRGTLKQRTRLVATLGVGGVVAGLTVLLAALIEGMHRPSPPHDTAGEPAGSEPVGSGSGPEGEESDDQPAGEGEDLSESCRHDDGVIVPGTTAELR